MNSRSILALAVLTLLGVIAALSLLQDESAPEPTVATSSPNERETSTAGTPAPIDPAPATPRDSSAAAGAEPMQGVRLEPAGVTGRVVDRQGQPLGDVDVIGLSVTGHSALRRYRPLGTETRTDDDGRFKLTPLPHAEPLAVQASDERHSPALVVPIELDEGALVDVGDIALRPGVRLHGLIIDPAGVPLPGAELQVFDLALGSGTSADEIAERGVLVATVVADANGAYELTQLGQRQYTLVVGAEGHVTLHGTLSFLLSQPAEWEQDFVLETASASVGGVVLDPDGNGVEDVRLRIMHRRTDSPTYFLATQTSDAGGAFRFDGVPEGPFDLRVEADDWYVDQLPQLKTGQLDHEVRVQPALAVNGLLVGDLIPERFEVRLSADSRSGAALLGSRSRNRTYEPGPDQAGTFVFDGLRPGSYVFEVVADGLAPSRSSDVILGGEVRAADVQILLRVGGAIVGRVTPAEAGARIELRAGTWDPTFALEHVFPTQPVHGLGAEVDDEGAFELAHVPEGEYVLTVKAEGYPPVHRRPVDVNEGRTTDLGTIKLPSGGSIRGQVTGVDGKPVPRARVDITGPTHTQSAVAGHDGSFLMAAVPPGDYAVRATPDNDISLALKYEARGQVSVYPDNESKVSLVFTPRPPNPR